MNSKHAGRKQWQPTPVCLPGESQGQGSLVGCRLWGHTESDMTEGTQQQQQQQQQQQKACQTYAWEEILYLKATDTIVLCFRSRHYLQLS